MKTPVNIHNIKTTTENSAYTNTDPFEDNVQKKINYYESDVLIIDLAEIVDTNPQNVNDRERLLVNTILEDLRIDIESKVLIEMTTTPVELGCLLLNVIRSIPKNNRDRFV